MKTDCFVCKNYTDNSNCSVCGNKKKYVYFKGVWFTTKNTPK